MILSEDRACECFWRVNDEFSDSFYGEVPGTPEVPGTFVSGSRALNAFSRKRHKGNAAHVVGA